jgi:hypothetical protein
MEAGYSAMAVLHYRQFASSTARAIRCSRGSIAVGEMTAKHRIARSALVGLAPLLLWAVVSCNGFFVTPTLSSIQLTPQNPSVAVGGALQLSVTGVNNDGTAGTLGAVTFTSSNPQIATVSASGMVTGVTAGTAIISAASGTVSGDTTVNVGGSGSGGLSIAPANETVSITVGSVQFTATSGGQDVTTTCTWTSSDTTVAQFNALTAGSATLLAQGGTTITATCGTTGTATTTLTVGP